ncbi:MAG TPA: MFS transporter [Chloroflexaceae bacterium]|nr:MFS transporter [Chloroflexaceae bacterium]
MRQLSGPARLYLVHTALLTFGLAVSSLFFNLLLVELGYDRRALALPVVGELSLLGLLNSLPVLVAALSSLPLWWLVSRVGPRPALVAGALLHAASLLGAALWPAPATMLAAVALGGPASVLFQVSAAPFMMRHSGPDERDLLFSLSAGLNIGVAGLGSLVGGFLPGLASELFGLTPQTAAAYRATFLVAAAVAALAAIPLMLNVERRTQQEDDAAASTGGAPVNLRYVLRSALYAVRFMVSPLLISCGAALLIPFLNIYFRQRFGAPDAALGAIFAAIGVATGAATLLAPLLSRRLGKMASVVLTQGLAIPCLLLLGLAPSLWLAGAVALLRGALMNMAAPLYDAYAMERSPEAARPIVIGLINGAFSAGYIVGPNISAQVQQSYGFAPLFVATACFYACAALANYLIFLRPGAAR